MSGNDFNFMKFMDVTAAAFLFIGGINWGLVGLFGVDLIAWVFGSGSILSKVIYVFVAVCAIYDAVMWKNIKKRWQCKGEFFSTAKTATV